MNFNNKTIFYSERIGGFAFFMNIINMIAANRDNPAPNINGTAAPKVSHKTPAIILAGNKAMPAIVDCKPSIVPFSSGGVISTT